MLSFQTLCLSHCLALSIGHLHVALCRLLLFSPRLTFAGIKKVFALSCSLSLSLSFSFVDNLISSQANSSKKKERKTWPRFNLWKRAKLFFLQLNWVLRPRKINEKCSLIDKRHKMKQNEMKRKMATTLMCEWDGALSYAPSARVLSSSLIYFCPFNTCFRRVGGVGAEATCRCAATQLKRSSIKKGNSNKIPFGLYFRYDSFWSSSARAEKYAIKLKSPLFFSFINKRIWHDLSAADFYRPVKTSWDNSEHLIVVGLRRVR